MIVDGWDFDPDQVMLAKEVAAAFRVDVSSVIRWAQFSKLRCIAMPNGTRLFSRQQIEHFKNRDNPSGWSFSPEKLMHPCEVALVFDVGPRSVTRWANTGELAHFRTPGGGRRFSGEHVESFLDACGVPREDGGDFDLKICHLMKIEEVADLFRVSAHTVGRWGNQGQLRMGRTPGGDPRFSRAQVNRLVADS